MKRFHSSAAVALIAFLCLTIAGVDCLAQKDLNQDELVTSDADAKEPEKQSSPASSGEDGKSAAVFTVLKLDPVQATNSLRELFRNEASRAPSIDADAKGGRIIVRGTKDQIRQVRSILRDMGETSPEKSPDTTTKPSDPSNPKLDSLFGKSNKSPVKMKPFPSWLPEATGSPDVPAPKRIEGTDVLLIETKDGLSGYSKSLGKWDRVIVGLPQDGRPRLTKATVSQNFASVVIDDQLFGFSGKSGQWSQLKIPSEFVGKIGPVHGMNILTVEIGDQTYALSPTRGAWVSSSEPVPPSVESHGNDVNVRDAEQKLGLAINSSESRRLKSEIEKLEELAAALASKIRTHSSAQGAKESATQESLTMRKELNAVLGKAFDLKSDLEHVRIKELLARLGQLEQQIGHRQALRSQIIDRRARELIDGEQTKWNDESMFQTSRGKPDTVRQQTPDKSSFTHKSELDLPAKDENPAGSVKNGDPKEAGDPLDPLHLPVVAKAHGDQGRKMDDPTAKQRVWGGPGDWTGQASLPSYKEIAKGILNSLDELEQAKSEYSRIDTLWQNKVVSVVEFEQAKRALDFAKRRLQIVQEDYRGTMHDLELQLREAVAESDRADKTLQRLLQLKPGIVSGQALNEAERDAERAKAPIERIKARYDLYRQAGEILPEMKRPEEQTQAKDDAFEIPSWGLKLAKSPVNELGDEKFRSGLRIIDVAAGSISAKIGLQKDDILVGLDQSDMPNTEILAQFLKQLDEQLAMERKKFKPGNGKNAVAIHIIRGKARLQGSILIQPEILVEVPELGK